MENITEITDDEIINEINGRILDKEEIILKSVKDDITTKYGSRGSKLYEEIFEFTDPVLEKGCVECQDVDNEQTENILDNLKHLINPEIDLVVNEFVAIYDKYSLPLDTEQVKELMIKHNVDINDLNYVKKSIAIYYSMDLHNDCDWFLKELFV